jgi:hypothetical protein
VRGSADSADLMLLFMCLHSSLVTVGSWSVCQRCAVQLSELVFCLYARLQGFMRIRRHHGKHGKCALASYPAMVFRKPLPDGTASAAAGHGMAGALSVFTS